VDGVGDVGIRASIPAVVLFDLTTKRADAVLTNIDLAYILKFIYTAVWHTG
jgi:hypothetical protein